MKKQYLLPLAALLMIGAFASAAWLYNRQQADQAVEQARANAELLVRDYSPRTGNPGARVTLVEFIDPACGTCAVFHPLVKQLMAEHEGRIKLVLRYVPFHPRADYVVKVLEAARLQGKFWEVLEVALETQSVWSAHGNPQPERIWMRLGRTGLDIQRAQRDMESPEIARRLEQDMADGRALGVNKTPSFYVNGEPLTRFGYDTLRQLVQQEIDASY